MELEWCCVEGNGPKWARLAALSDDGTVFIPAALMGNETRAFLCASWDGLPAAMEAGHVYLPAKWMASNCPDIADDILNTEVSIRRAFKKLYGSGR
jgi:hypothetical protein